MRVLGPVLLALALAACGGGGRAPVDPEAPVAGDRESPFADRRDFEPKAFGVEVRGSGRPILFIPGLGSPGLVWAETVRRLEDRHECHVLTLSGFAGRPPIAEPLSAAVRRDLVRYIRSRRLRDPIVVGHSMGGFIALWLAVSSPANTGPVIIVDAGPALSGDLDDARLLRERWVQASDEEFARRARFMYAGMASSPKRLAAISALAAKSDRRTIGDAIYEMMITNLTDRMPEIRSPVLFLLADGPLQHRIRRQAAGVPDKAIVVVPRARHFVMIDAPDRFVEELEAFLDEHPPGR
jgi:pimeloyl-ACP methyl ester carboxylesterase